MIGHVDNAGRALVSVSIQAAPADPVQEIEAWIDTGFNGELVVPRLILERLGVPQSGTAKAILADGSEVVVRLYTCLVDWHGIVRTLEVVANDGTFPLLGVGLLQGRELYINYRSSVVAIK